jgi:hypothetical protein
MNEDRSGLRPGTNFYGGDSSLDKFMKSWSFVKITLQLSGPA